MTDVDGTWDDLCARLGIEAVTEDVAIVPHATPITGPALDALLVRITVIHDGLRAAGRDHAALVVVAHLTPSDTQALFDAGAHVVPPPAGCGDLDAVGCRDAVMSMLGPLDDADLASAPAPTVLPCGPDAYAGRNPDLTDADVARWYGRLTTGSEETT